MRWLKCFVFVLLLVMVGCSPLTLSEESEEESVVVNTTEVEQNSCLAGEVYIVEEDTCVLPLECDDYDSCVARGDELVYLLEDEYGSLTAEESVSTDLEGTHDLYVYEIDNEKEMIFTDDDVTTEEIDYHAELWFDFAWLIPESEREDINQFIIFESGDTLAYVQQYDDSGQYWTLGMNKENIELASETMITYIHEYAHYLSLKDGEQNIWVELDACEDILIEDEGCFYEDAYLVYFYEQFWQRPSEYENDYVSEYATSSVFEDFAESFAHFVLTPQPVELKTLADEKIAFFYEWEYFVELRAQILTRAATWLVRAVV
ncbi:putative zinc-binding metallopeptidase [Metasolibacillus meyeri]|uniref:Zinc-binding metallopeptidase n=1 Tax=Metasolibacillus meyeri TaxID=1071052 RepID=A0AAW9NRB6_9BACL|nr:putative zinc-binding metallopeptidase [Metasolibacillus meyeri]MEC1180247.1 putative zinc-binding metallopeptidase [Metasolibacillus meyeri]